jgi:hypothetical protein
MTPKFEIVDASMIGENNLSIKTVIVDDARFVGYIFHFDNVAFDYESDGIGVSYDLNIDIHEKFLPTTISDEQTKTIEKVAHSILEKIMNDLIDVYNSDPLDNPAWIV